MFRSCHRKLWSLKRCLWIYKSPALRSEFKHALHVCMRVRRRKGKSQCAGVTQMHILISSQVPLIPASLVSNMHGVLKMLLSVTSFWQFTQVQHPSCFPQSYQGPEMPLAGGGVWGMVAALSVKPFSPVRPCFNDPEIAAGSQFSSVSRESLLRITATHWPVPTRPRSSSNSRAGRQQ